MKRFLLLFCFSFCIVPALKAQRTQYFIDNVSNNRYRVGDVSITEKPHNGTDTIAVIQGDFFSLIRKTETNHRVSVDVRNIVGVFTYEELFQRAVIIDHARSNTKGGARKSNAAASEKYKAADSTLVAFTKKLQSILSHEKESYTEVGKVQVSIINGQIAVKNQSRDRLFVDIIWMKNRRCYSALSYSADFVSLDYLDSDEIRYFNVDKYALTEALYVVCTRVPIRYNTIDLDEFSSMDESRDIDIPLTITRVK